MQKKINYTLLFKVFYLLHVLLAFNCFLYRMKILDYTSILITVMGIILLINRVRNIKNNVSYKFLWILILFLFSYVISMLVNWKYGYIGNIKGGMWMTFQFFLLYLMETEEQENKYIHELKVLSSVLIIYTFVCSFLGVLMTIFSYGGRFNFEDGTGTFYGFIWGRLWGCYTDPNHGALITAVAVFLAIYLFQSTQKIILKIILSISIIINYLYLVFSDSRSAKISFTIGCMVWFYWFLRGRKKEQKVYKKILNGVLIVLVTLGVYISFGVVKNIYNSYVVSCEQSEQLENIQTMEVGKEKTLGREADIEEDYSNRRFDIWKSGAELFNENKIVGITFRNIVSYAETEMPDTYIISNDYGKFNSFHNVVIDVLVSQGIIGIVIFFVLGMAIFIYAVKKMIFEEKYKSLECQILFPIILLLAIDSMFISAIFYVNSPETVLFWSLLGYFVWFLGKKEEKKCTN